jgi:hypothetical protein
MAKKGVQPSPKAEKPWPRGTRQVFLCRSQAVDFLRAQGGPYGVQLTLDRANARKLRNALDKCNSLAKEAGRDRVDIDARWGNTGGEAGDRGFRLEVKVRREQRVVDPQN